ncbi:Serine_threonine-protein kinase PknD [Nocardiopsis dassonvillei]|uniref:serine/threonine-protein kinase n=1 Tax=Nocardiopsis dassonvillei TaxID=2014 RepID=UPI003F564D13
MSSPHSSAGRYELRERLGAGGMGTVWHAWDPALQRDVAVKEVVLPEGMSSEDRDEARERTLREARATARIRDNAVVTVHDVLEHEGSPWIVMELLSGRSLQHHLDQDGPMPAARVEEAARSLLSGLGAAHAVGVTHRDVKPANIMLTEDGRTVLTDFGIANVDGSTALTQTGVYIGSPEYMAPERFEGERALPASDLWSLGVTLYALLEGRSPFKRESVTGIISAVLTAPMPPRLSAPGGTGDVAAAPLRALIGALLNRDVASRPSAARALELLDRAKEESVRDGGTTRVAGIHAGSGGAPGDSGGNGGIGGPAGTGGTTGVAGSGGAVGGAAPGDSPGDGPEPGAVTGPGVPSGPPASSGTHPPSGPHAPGAPSGPRGASEAHVPSGPRVPFGTDASQPPSGAQAPFGPHTSQGPRAAGTARGSQPPFGPPAPSGPGAPSGPYASQLPSGPQAPHGAPAPSGPYASQPPPGPRAASGPQVSAAGAAPPASGPQNPYAPGGPRVPYSPHPPHSAARAPGGPRAPAPGGPPPGTRPGPAHPGHTGSGTRPVARPSAPGPVPPVTPLDPPGPWAQVDRTAAARGFVGGVGHTGPSGVPAPVPTRAPAPRPSFPVIAACTLLGLNGLYLLALALLSLGGSETAFAGWGGPLLLALWGGFSAASVAGLLLRSRVVYGLVVLLQVAVSVALVFTMFTVVVYARDELPFYLAMLLFNLLVGGLLLIPPRARAYFRLGSSSD